MRYLAPIVALLLASRVSASVQTPLDSTDFSIADVRERLDSGQVRRLLGAPDSVHVAPSPFDVGGKIVTWWYPGLSVHFQFTNYVRGLTLSRSGRTTRRGLQVGDSVAVVERLYGPPTRTTAGSWLYEEPARRRHAMRLTVQAGRVTAVYLGWFVD
jgi:hypothetical protein